MVHYQVRSGDTDQVGVEPIFWTTIGVMPERGENVRFNLFGFMFYDDDLLVDDLREEVQIIWLPDQ